MPKVVVVFFNAVDPENKLDYNALTNECTSVTVLLTNPNRKFLVRIDELPEALVNKAARCATAYRAAELGDINRTQYQTAKDIHAHFTPIIIEEVMEYASRQDLLNSAAKAANIDVVTTFATNITLHFAYKRIINAEHDYNLNGLGYVDVEFREIVVQQRFPDPETKTLYELAL